MRATSRSQLEAIERGGIPDPEEVREGLWTFALPLPHAAAHVVPYTLSHLVLDARGDVHLIDTGWGSEENWRRLVDALAVAGRSIDDVATVTVTHLHHDHLGLADRVRAASGAAIAIHRAEVDAMCGGLEPVDRAHEWGVPHERQAELAGTAARHTTVEPDVLLDDGDRLTIPGRDITVVHTPGHTTGHVSLRDATGLLFTGDHVLPTVFPGLGLGADAGNPIAAYLASLERVLEFADDEVLPGHGYRFVGLAERVRETAEHHRTRTEQVAEVLASHPQLTVWELASRLTWTLGWEGLQGLTLRSALAQSAWHRELAGH